VQDDVVDDLVDEIVGACTGVVRVSPKGNVEVVSFTFVLSMSFHGMFATKFCTRCR
jgi:hypothetical protein